MLFLPFDDIPDLGSRFTLVCTGRFGRGWYGVTAKQTCLPGYCEYAKQRRISTYRKTSEYYANTKNDRDLKIGKIHKIKLPSN
jgi:hypothetical protein